MSGFELGDWKGFFSQEFPNKGLKGELIKANRNSGEIESKWIVHFNKGKILVEDYFNFNKENVLVRTTEFKTLSETYLGDIVQRWKILGPNVIIKNKKLVHKSSNIYSQLKSKSNFFELKFPFRINDLDVIAHFNLSLENSKINQSLTYCPYIRDERKTYLWILHNRIRAIQGEEKFFKGCKTWYNDPLPTCLNKLMLKSKYLSKNLLYIRERNIPNSPIQMVINKMIPQNTAFRFKTTLGLNINYDNR